MKRIMILCLMLSCLIGCSKEKDMENEMNSRYENYIELIINNNGAASVDIPFEYNLDILKSDENTYIYELAIHDPIIAMYDVELLAVDLSQMSEDFIAPSIGVVEDEIFNMLPYQSDIDKGFYPGLAVNGVSPNDTVKLDILVVYKDSTQTNEKYIFFSATKSYVEPEDLVEDGQDGTDENEEPAE